MRGFGRIDLRLTEHGKLVVGDIELVSGTRTVLRGGQKMDLTSVEFAILETLLRLAGQAVSRDDLVKQALGRDLSAYDRSSDVSTDMGASTTAASTQSTALARPRAGPPVPAVARGLPRHDALARSRRRAGPSA